MSEKPDALDILLGNVVVQHAGNLTRIVAVDRNGVQTVYADWTEGPVVLEVPAPRTKLWWQFWPVQAYSLPMPSVE